MATDLRVSQVPVEIEAARASTSLNLTQVIVEVLTPVAMVSTDFLLTQVPVEVQSGQTNTELAATMAYLEVLTPARPIQGKLRYWWMPGAKGFG